VPNVTFDNAPEEFARWIEGKLGREGAGKGRLIRDIYGQLRLVTIEDNAKRLVADLESVRARLGAYAAPGEGLVTGVAETKLQEFLREPSLAIAADSPVRLIDRRVAGGEWLVRPAPLAEQPQRLVFHSVKGGVGRSTALAITAAHLAARGYNLLIVDLDLEAPGLGSTLLGRDEMPDFGVVDWFAALAAGAESDEMLVDMISPSSFTSNRAVVDVVPARGRAPGAYLSKLARAYIPGSVSATFAGFNFAQKADLLIRKLCERRAYDIVLIDGRAGLHETSGSLLLGLGGKVLLFATASEQSFDDFTILFDGLRSAFDPEVGGADIRGAFKMVHAKAPPQENALSEFREKSWDLWRESLYDDETQSTTADSPASEALAFTFDVDDDDAPHYPLEIRADESYARFDPRADKSLLTAERYLPAFGPFLAGVEQILRLT
jgi:cellulose biosynthesis protein BcsQ